VKERVDWVAWSALAAMLALGYGFVGGAMAGQSAAVHCVVWLVTAACFVVVIHRLGNRKTRTFFLFAGYLVVFAVLFRVALGFFGTTFPKSLPDPLSALPPRSATVSEAIDYVVDALALPRVLMRRLESVLDPDKSLDLIFTGPVVRVADGDTLTVRVNGTDKRIRLSEIDAPEARQAWGANAKAALTQKVNRKTVRILVSEKDRYDRYLGKVWVGQRDINREMVAEGHAWVYRRYLDDISLLRAERQAKHAQRGLWQLHNPQAPWNYRQAQR
jgi:endonuclease YncB( thermonuclease family)